MCMCCVCVVCVCVHVCMCTGSAVNPPMCAGVDVLLAQCPPPTHREVDYIHDLYFQTKLQLQFYCVIQWLS